MLSRRSALLLLTAAALPLPRRAKAQAALTVDAIEAASWTGSFPAGQSGFAVKVQVLLDRAGISPGVADGVKGGMSRSAITSFQRRAGLPVTGEMTDQVWSLLQGWATEPITKTYTVTAADGENLVDRIPDDYAEKAAMTHQGYTSIAERLAERFHMDEAFLKQMNPGVQIVPGAVLTVTDPGPEAKGQVTWITVNRATRRVTGYDKVGQMLVDYPATIGSTSTPSPAGSYKVANVALDPNYTYNPAVNFRQGENDKPLVIPPGPNGPVGNVWIGLSRPTYGIHGTATPSRLFANQSHGCVRLTNWDARELAHMVKAGVTHVDFIDNPNPPSMMPVAGN
ncbi:MAG: L,D-transpeptidase [Paracoccus sp. (in: a-proteobacteria)]|uniref:L,D-transpeptidase family protein n=1 Tax=Paracoccus sp. TaxID=267 RepID=UPI0026E0417C|nr:L,D-transpeptidase [Paracoccus sp. (in: a-proteobacteria)]MDO5621225.1 L,D-transpeptidase [Paracoccus sp. (in: a-proteobacteria)]